ncbi:MAG TPA: class I SAM-dependent methyltransferase [Candidatus Acidoferrales bacterium]|nr:class I SAM-dependent methyltransferase [Candidatus Acidoferrales bacterium]
MMDLIEVGSPEYALAFRTLVRNLECAKTEETLRRVMGRLPRGAKAVDWGAGAGRNTRMLCARFDTVYAVEPSTALRSELAQSAPKAVVINGSIQTATLPERVDFGLISHVYYHIPDDQWGELTARCGSYLTDQGTLVVVLKHRDSECNRMLEAFGAPRFDLFTIAAALREQAQYTVEFKTVPAKIATTSFADTLTIARFMLSDRSAASFSRLPSKEEFEAYVRKHFWDDKTRRGGWECADVLAFVRPNRRKEPTSERRPIRR